MHIIPAIDIYRNECVRLIEGDFSKKTIYTLSPFETAERFLKAGATMLHVVDLEGAKAGRVMNMEAISSIRKLKSLELQVGGGVRTSEAVQSLLELEIDRVVVGSVVLRSPELFASWVKEFGAKRFCVALDVKDGQLAYDGWQLVDSSDLPSTIRRLTELGIIHILTTDIRRDGKLEGPNIDLYKYLVEIFPTVNWIASGGVRSRHDVEALRATGVAGVVIGKALHEGHVRLEDLLEAPC